MQIFFIFGGSISLNHHVAYHSCSWVSWSVTAAKVSPAAFSSRLTERLNDYHATNLPSRCQNFWPKDPPMKSLSVFFFCLSMVPLEASSSCLISWISTLWKQRMYVHKIWYIRVNTVLKKKKCSPKNWPLVYENQQSLQKKNMEP